MIARSRALAGALLAACLLIAALGAGPASAAATWGVTMTHQNAWGFEGVTDPYLHSATTFARPSGGNHYTITVTNTSATETAGGAIVNPGQTLSCSGGPSTATLGYQWLRNGANIAGATASTYTAAPADEGKEIQCQVKATNSEGASLAFSTGTMVSPAPAVNPPSPGTPTVSGTLADGNALTCNSGAWTGNPSFAYQWLRNGAAIAAATSSTYTLTSADDNTAVQCRVTGTNAGGAAVGATATAVPRPAAPADTAAPTIADTTQTAVPPLAGDVLSCSTGTWTGGAGFSYQWLSGGAPATGAGASTSSYTVAAADAGKALQCQVTDANSDGSSLALSAAAVAQTPPSPAPPVPTIAPGITGTRNVGQALTCGKGFWSNTPTTYTYTFLRNGTAVAASGPTAAISFPYTLVAADEGKAIQCEVTAANASGTAAALTATTATVVTPAALPAPPVATAAVPTTGNSVSVSDRLPAGLVFDRSTSEAGVAVHATGWSCSAFGAVGTGFSPDGTSITCARSDALAPGASYPPIVLGVRVTPGAPDSVTDIATVSGGGAPTASASEPTEIATVPFGIQSLVSGAFGPGAAFNLNAGSVTGAPDTQAGGHPFAISGTVLANVVSIDNGSTAIVAGGNLHDLFTDLPAGLVGNPQNAPQCPLPVYNKPLPSVGANCPAASRIGYVNLAFKNVIGVGPNFGPSGPGAESGSNVIPLYNLTPPPGSPAMLGFDTEGESITLAASVRSSGDYGVTVASTEISTSPAIVGAQLVVCENGVTGSFLTPVNAACAPPNPAAIPFLTNPTSCAKDPLTTLSVDNWLEPGGPPATMDSYANAPSAPPAAIGQHTTTTPVASSALSGCQQLTENWVSNPEYSPAISFQPESSQADAPSGYEFDLHVPQPESEESLATPALDNSTVTLPKGVAINPAAADGLQACSEEQIGLISEEPIHFDEAEPNCPNGSKVGTMEIETPLLTKPLEGSVYLAQQHANPFHSDYALYLAVDDQTQGVVVKVAGKVEPDPVTGQITAHFEENPQLPFTDLKLRLFGGPRASLVNPTTCGTTQATARLTPWSAADPANPTAAETATPSSPLTIGSGPGGGACSATPQSRPFAPALAAGAEAATAGAHSPFTLKLTRNDGEQEFSAIDATLPPGFSAVLKGVPYCQNADIEAAALRTGAAELANPSCPAASQIGSLTTGAGAGSDPYYVNGKAYLAGPYKGAPVSIAFITPAVAGPFDLGNVVVRAAVYVNPETAQITTKTDPLPQILEGVPLQIRTIVAKIDRPNFALNPTSCEKFTVATSIAGSSGATASPSNPFQVGDCGALAFKPKLGLSLKGGTRRNGYPALTATLNYPPGSGYANVRSVQVALPHSEFLAQEHIRTVCTRVQFAAHECPAGSIYGHAEATTPLLEAPLTGPVYLRSSSNKLPDLVVALKGPESQPIEVVLDGRVDSVHGGIRNTFEVVPDAPVSKFVLSMQGGKKGLLVNSTNICEGTHRATARIVGQNGKRADQFPLLQSRCPKGAEKQHKGKAHHKKASLQRPPGVTW